MRFKQYLNTISHNEIVQERLSIIKFFDEFGSKATKKAFGFGRSTIHLWKKRYKDSKYNPESLIPKTKRPKNTRRMRVDEKILGFIRNLRENNYHLGKEKIKVLLDMYCEKERVPKVSESLIGKIIKRNNYFFSPPGGKVYHNPNNKPTIPGKKKVKVRLPKEYKCKRAGNLIQIDTVQRFDFGTKRYILTAIDLFSRFTFAFAYKKLSSGVSLDFFKKLKMVSPFEIEAVKTDNGLEFLGEFDMYLTSQGIIHYFSYPRTPKSNAFVERFNRTIQEEFVNYNLEYLKDTQVFNQNMMEYLIYYNQVRPHKSLENQTPLGYLVSQGILSSISVTSTSR